MKIQFNTDRNIDGNEKLEAYINSVVTNELERYSDQITRIEIHLSDENGEKSGQQDKRCLLEARIENRQPIAVTSHADTVEASINNALEKLKASLETIFGNLANR